MKQITVKELYRLCSEEIERGNSKKNIVISDDDYGNGYHGLFFGFTDVETMDETKIYDSETKSSEKTIILG